MFKLDQDIKKALYIRILDYAAIAAAIIAIVIFVYSWISGAFPGMVKGFAEWQLEASKGSPYYTGQ